MDCFTELFGRENVLICGNFNAKSVLWGSPEGHVRIRLLGESWMQGGVKYRYPHKIVSVRGVCVKLYRFGLCASWVH